MKAFGEIQNYYKGVSCSFGQRCHVLFLVVLQIPSKLLFVPFHEMNRALSKFALSFLL
jgi:hypothetical protein